jgi:hypothetical protein
MLKQIFSDAAMPVTVGEGVAPCPVQIADALAPSHVVILSALEGDHCSPPTPELKLWIASEGLDWRFGGTDVSTTQTDDAKTMAPSLEDLFDEKLQPTVLPLADFLQPVLEGGGMLGADPATCQTSQRSWFDHDATPPHKRTENCDTTVSNPSSLLAPLDAWWKQTLVDVIENESHGHLGTPILRSSSHLVSNIPECAFGPAPAPSSLVIGTKSGEAPVQNLVVKVKDYTAPAHRGQFDDISVCEYDELHYRSAYLRGFLMENVMQHLTKAMLDIIRLPDGEDKIAKLADILAFEARRVEDRSEAHAYLRYRSSLAKLNELRQADADEYKWDAGDTDTCVQ